MFPIEGKIRWTETTLKDGLEPILKIHLDMVALQRETKTRSNSDALKVLAEKPEAEATMLSRIAKDLYNFLSSNQHTESFEIQSLIAEVKKSEKLDYTEYPCGSCLTSVEEEDTSFGPCWRFVSMNGRSWCPYCGYC